MAMTVDEPVRGGNPQYGVQLQPTDMPSFPEACGVPGYTVGDSKLVRSKLWQALDQPGVH